MPLPLGYGPFTSYTVIFHGGSGWRRSRVPIGTPVGVTAFGS